MKKITSILSMSAVLLLAACQGADGPAPLPAPSNSQQSQSNQPQPPPAK